MKTAPTSSAGLIRPAATATPAVANTMSPGAKKIGTPISSRNMSVQITARSPVPSAPWIQPIGFTDLFSVLKSLAVNQAERGPASELPRTGRRTSWVVRTWSVPHVYLYRLGLGRRMGKLQVILLTTKGRKTGRSHTVPLNTIAEDGGFVVVGSNGGSDFDPNWWLNLVADPTASVQVGGQVMPARMEPITDPAERQRLWDKFVAAMRGYAGYQKGTSRTIPLGLLRPT